MRAGTLWLAVAVLAVKASASAWAEDNSCSTSHTELAEVKVPAKGVPESFVEAEKLNQELWHSKIDSTPSPREDYSKRLSASIKQKSAMLEEVVAAYEEVVSDREDQWKLAALFRVGEAYIHFAESIEGASHPKKFNAAQKKTYCETLKKRSAAYREKAAQYFEACSKAAGTVKDRGEWAALCERALQASPAAAGGGGERSGGRRR